MLRFNLQQMYNCIYIFPVITGISGDYIQSKTVNGILTNPKPNSIDPSKSP